MLNRVLQNLAQPVLQAVQRDASLVLQSVERGLQQEARDVFSKAPTFLKTLNPDQAVKMTFEEAIPLFEQLGAFKRGELTVEQVMQMSLRGEKVPSNVQHLANSDWMKTAKFVGIHPRAIGTYPNMAKYAMTFPEETVHFLPMLETGAGDSLYSAASLNYSREFLCPELVKKGFDTPDKQLLLTTNLLRAIGKRVGFDAVPHLDRFSEPVLANPHLFEWIKTVPQPGKSFPRILNTAELSHQEAAKSVEETILQYLKEKGSASGKPLSPQCLDRDYFFRTLSEEERMAHLYGSPSDLAGRTTRRVELMHKIREQQFETMPVIGDAPYGKVEIVGFEDEAKQWFKFAVPDHQKHYGKDVVMFSNVTGYRWFNRNPDGTLSIPTSLMLNAGQDTRHLPAWDYFAQHIKRQQEQFGLDFVRADMAHMQLSHAHGRPFFELDPRNEFWRHMKDTVQRDQRPSFGVLGEAFYSPQFVDPVRHCETLGADVVYGNMQYAPTQTGEFLRRAKEYSLLGLNHPGVTHRPLFNVMTADSDKIGLKIDQLLDPNQRLIRYFYSLFGGNPGYMGMGFEARTHLLDKWKQLLQGKHHFSNDELSRLLPNPHPLVRRILGQDPTLGLRPEVLEAFSRDPSQAFYNKLKDHLMARSPGLGYSENAFKEALDQLKTLMNQERDAVTESFINGRPWEGASYRWGQADAEIRGPMTQMRTMFDRLKARLAEWGHWWIPVEGSEVAAQKVGSWSFYHPQTKKPELLCIGNTDLHSPISFHIPNPTSIIVGSEPASVAVMPIFQTSKLPVFKRTIIPKKGAPFHLTNVPPGECVVFRVKSRKPKSS